MTDQNNLPSEDELNKSHGADHQLKNNSSEKTQEEKQSPSRGTKKTTPEEELKSRFGGTAKVLKEASSTKRTSLAIGIGGVVVILILLMGHHHQEEKKEDAVRQQKILEASQAIKSRLDALKEDPEKTPKAPTPFMKREQEIQATVSKEMIARMNAPTVIYEGGSNAYGSSASATSNAGANNGVQEATFMGKGADQAFGNTPYETSTVDAAQVPHPDYTIVSGEMIHATLNVAMNSDLPGMVTATVTSPAYSYTGENELVPRGSRLIGQYSSAVLQGQSRIFIMWNRLVLPNGTSVNINSPDTDQIGQAGEPADYINRHFWSRFGESVLMSILSAGVSNIDVDSSDEYNSAQAYRIAVAESLQESAAGTLKQTLMQKPTLVRYQGASINVFIAHDLSFYNLYKAQGKAY